MQGVLVSQAGSLVIALRERTARQAISGCQIGRLKATRCGEEEGETETNLFRAGGFDLDDLMSCMSCGFGIDGCCLPLLVFSSDLGGYGREELGNLTRHFNKATGELLRGNSNNVSIQY